MRKTDKHVRYVIVVHGIGEQRKNETVINVVNQFARARRKGNARRDLDVLSLGRASGQTGTAKDRVDNKPVEFMTVAAEIAEEEKSATYQSQVRFHD